MRIRRSVSRGVPAGYALCAAVLALLSGCQPSIHDLVARGELGRVRTMLDAHPHLVDLPGHLGKQPLHYAVTFHQPEALELLVARGAELSAPDDTGMTPLHAAAMLGRAEEAEMLLEFGADAAARDAFGDTPAHTAAASGMGNVLQVLAVHGADLALLNNAGHTPLDLARRNRQDRVVRFLLRLLPANAA